jgi:transposase-like protein
VLAPTRSNPSLVDLPADQATALLLAAQPGVTYRDVAQRLDVDPAVVLAWLRDGLRRMGRRSAEEVPAQPLPQLHRQLERFEVDALVLPVEA